MALYSTVFRLGLQYLNCSKHLERTQATTSTQDGSVWRLVQ